MKTILAKNNSKSTLLRANRYSRLSHDKLLNNFLALFFITFDELKNIKMLKGLLLTHFVSVIIFFMIYLFKTILLVTNKKENLARFAKIVKVPEMIVSALFLITGIYLLMQFGLTKILLIKIIVVLISIPLAIIGFKKENKVLAVVSFLLIVTAFGLGEMNKKRIAKQTVDPEVADISNPNYDIKKHGEAVYTAYCIRCHGVGGTNGAGGIDLTISQTEHVSKIERIVNGKGSMAPFKDALNAQEIDAVVAYVESLKK